MAGPEALAKCIKILACYTPVYAVVLYSKNIKKFTPYRVAMVAKDNISFWKKFQDSRWFIFVTGVICTLVFAWTHLNKPAFLASLDLIFYDQLLYTTRTPKTTGIPVVVDLDEKTLTEYGQWPWPRYRVALLVAKIRDAGALAIGVDSVFSEPDNASPNKIEQNLAKDLQLTVDLKSVFPPGLMDNDKILGNVLADGPFVLGYFFHFEETVGTGEERCQDTLPARIIEKRAPGVKGTMADSLLQATDIICNVPALTTGMPLSGFFNTIPDFDGVYRRSQLFVSYKGKVYPSLAIATLMRAYGIKQILVGLDQFGITEVRLGRKFTIPVNSKGEFYTNYRGPEGTFQYISASTVLSDKLKPDELKGKIVFFGTSAAGLKDLRSTPFDPTMPGVEVHATMVDNILAGDYIGRPEKMLGYEALAVLAVGLLTTILLTWSGIWWSVIPLIGLTGFVWYGSVYFMDEKHIFFSPGFILYTIIANFTILTALRYWREEGQKKFLHSTFSSYLAPELIEEMVNSKSTPELGGEERQLTAFFSDIQNFSTFSEMLTAPQLVELLNEYLSTMTDVLLRERGTLDKYEGDAIVAFFGAPVQLPDHALRACRVAVDMQKSLAELRKKWAGEKCPPDVSCPNVTGVSERHWPKTDKWPKLVHNMQMRIGLNSGKIVVGNMGGSTRMNYTIMGDAVNLAARLESGAKQYGISIMVSEYVLDEVIAEKRRKKIRVKDRVHYRFIDNIIVKGRTDPVKIYELLGVDDKLSSREEKLCLLFEKGTQHYLIQEFDVALDYFQQAAPFEKNPQADVTPSKVFIKRCLVFQKKPPVPAGEKWDGVFVMAEK